MKYTQVKIYLFSAKSFNEVQDSLKLINAGLLEIFKILNNAPNIHSDNSTIKFNNLPMSSVEEIGSFENKIRHDTNLQTLLARQ